jgi:hypothetical protein
LAAADHLVEHLCRLLEAMTRRLSGAEFAYVRHLRLVRSRIAGCDALEGEVEMFISQKMDA